MIVTQDNKRDYFRMLINTSCEVIVNEPEGKRTLAAVCTDMSATGIALTTQQEVAMGAEVEISIESQNDHFTSLLAQAKVVRCEQQQDGDYKIGLQVIRYNN